MDTVDLGAGGSSFGLSASPATYVTDAAELAAALDAATGGETILLKPGVYDAVAVVNLLASSTVTIASADPDSPALLTGLVIRDSANITVRNVEMLDRDAATRHDFSILGSRNISFDQLKVWGLDGDNSAPVMIRDSSDITVTNSEFTHARYAVSMLDNSGVTISGNYFHDLRTDGVRGGGNSNVVISDNFFTNFRPAEGDHADAIQFWTTNTTTSAENIRITGNVIVRGEGGATQGIFMRDEAGGQPYKNVVIEGNLAAGTLYNGIRVGNADNVTVNDNTVVGFSDQKSWISVPADAVLIGNSAQHFTIGGVSVGFPAENTMLPASRDGGAAVIGDWRTNHTTSYDYLLQPLSLDPDTAPNPSLDDWRLFAGSGFAGGIDGSGAVFGTSGLQDIQILDGPGSVLFDPSFNGGGDIIRLAGNADSWSIAKSGSSALLSNGSMSATIPVGTAGMSISFDDGVRNLRYDTNDQTFKIGSQAFGNSAVPITAAADGSGVPVEQSETALAKLLLLAGGAATADGNFNVFGTSASEHVSVVKGHFTLDPSFNRGGDTISFDLDATAFTAVRSGSSVTLESATAEVRVPVGTAGLELSFAGDERTLLFDTATGAVLIGDQPIGFDPVPLTDFA